MIQKLFITAFFTLVSAAAFAAPEKFSCSNIGGVQTWNVFVDLEVARAGFSDGEAIDIILLKEVRTSQTLPRQMIYLFEGVGRDGILRVEFNDSDKTAKITIDVGTAEAMTLTAVDGCKPDASFKLYRRGTWYLY